MSTAELIKNGNRDRMLPIRMFTPEFEYTWDKNSDSPKDFDWVTPRKIQFRLIDNSAPLRAFTSFNDINFVEKELLAGTYRYGEGFVWETNTYGDVKKITNPISITANGLELEIPKDNGLIYQLMEHPANKSMLTIRGELNNMYTRHRFYMHDPQTAAEAKQRKEQALADLFSIRTKLAHYPVVRTMMSVFMESHTRDVKGNPLKLSALKNVTPEELINLLERNYDINNNPLQARQLMTDYFDRAVREGRLLFLLMCVLGKIKKNEGYQYALTPIEGYTDTEVRLGLQADEAIQALKNHGQGVLYEATSTYRERHTVYPQYSEFLAEYEKYSGSQQERPNVESKSARELALEKELQELREQHEKTTLLMKQAYSTEPIVASPKKQVAENTQEIEYNKNTYVLTYQNGDVSKLQVVVKGEDGSKSLRDVGIENPVARKVIEAAKQVKPNL